MVRSILLRILGAVPVLLLVAVGIFAMLRLAPGDAAAMLAADDASEEDMERLRQQWGLDQPIFVQFGYFLVNAVRLDFGVSFRYGEPVLDIILQRLPATIELALTALVLAIVIAVPLGLITALRKDSTVDAVGSLVAVAGVSAPAFWVGILLVLFFSAHLSVLPSSGRMPYGINVPQTTGLLVIDSLVHGRFDALRLALLHLVLPAFTIAVGMVGIITRITRSAIIDVGQEEFVFTAVSKGLSRGQIVRDHLLPNAAIPITTIIGLELGVLISGSIIVEVVFSWPGLGQMLYQAVSVRDIPLVTGVVITYTTIFIFLNILVDILYVIIDPRLRSGRAI